MGAQLIGVSTTLSTSPADLFAIVWLVALGETIWNVNNQQYFRIAYSTSTQLCDHCCLAIVDHCVTIVVTFYDSRDVHNVSGYYGNCNEINVRNVCGTFFMVDCYK